ncbi:hypothetical protein HDV05_000324, partial [Chytridiales sp. JEL 0842]
METVYHDLVGVERRVNGIIETFSKDEDFQPEMQAELQRSIEVVEHILGIHAETTGAVQKHLLAGSQLDKVELAIVRLSLEVLKVEASFDDYNAHNDTLSAAIVEAKKEFVEPLRHAINPSQQVKSQIRKLGNKMAELLESGAAVTEHIIDPLDTLYNEFVKATKYAKLVSEQLGLYLAESSEQNKPVTLDSLLDILSSVSKKVFGNPEESVGASLSGVITSIKSQVSSVLEKWEQASASVKVTKEIAPWMIRSQQFKSGFAVNAEMEKQLESQNEEILLLISDVKSKTQYQQEAKIKIDLLEKKMEIAKFQSDKAVALEAEVAKLKEKEQSYTEVIEQLQEDVARMEQENAQYQKLTRRTGSTPKRGERDFAGQAMPGMGLKHGHGMDLQDSLEMLMDGDLASQFESLKSALKYLRAENTRLKSSLAMKSSQGLFNRNDPLMKRAQRGSLTTSSDTKILMPNTNPSIPNQNSADSKIIPKIIQKSKELALEANELLLTTKVVDLTMKVPERGTWKSSKDPTAQYRNRELKFAHLVRQSEDLYDDVRQISVKIVGHQ